VSSLIFPLFEKDIIARRHLPAFNWFKETKIETSDEYLRMFHLQFSQAEHISYLYRILG